MNGKILETVELKQEEEMRDLFSSAFTEENVFLEPPTPQDPDNQDSTSEPYPDPVPTIHPSDFYVATLEFFDDIYEVLINVNNHITILTELTETIARQKAPRLPKPKKTKAKKTKLKPKKAKVKKVKLKTKKTALKKTKVKKVKVKKIKAKKPKVKPKKAKAKAAPSVTVKPKIKSKRTGKAPGRPTKKPPKVLPKAKQDLLKVKSKTGR